MRAILMTAVREPLETRDVPDPQPGPGQVRIRLHATGSVVPTCTCGMENSLFRCRLF